MATQKKSLETKPKTSPEARISENRENQLIEKAYRLVEQRLDDGTASAQETVHFLKMGARKTKLEQERLMADIQLLVSKKEVIDASKQSGIAYQEALAALRSYSGSTDEED